MNIEATLDSLDSVTQALIQKLKSNTIVLLRGNLASGKTTLTKALVKAMGINSSVTSPTFSIQQSYENRVFHYDIYNKDTSYFVSMGLLDELDKDGIHIIEWADDKLEKILKDYGFYTISVSIEPIGENKRLYRINDV